MEETIKETKKASVKEDENVLLLKTPIMIDDKTVKELCYDFGELEVEDYVSAEKRLRQKLSGTTSTDMQEFDRLYHLYIFLYAVLKKNIAYELQDVERIKGRDVVEAIKLGRTFILGGAEDGGPSPSEKQ